MLLLYTKIFWTEPVPTARYTVILQANSKFFLLHCEYAVQILSWDPVNGLPELHSNVAGKKSYPSGTENSSAIKEVIFSCELLVKV